MRASPVGVGIDIGTTNTKVVVADADGACVVRSRPTPHSAGELAATVLALVAEVVAASDRRPVALGIAAMAESGFPLDTDGRALAPLLSWQDSRSDAALRRWADSLGPDSYYTATGVRPGPKPPLALWLDLAGRDPDLLAAMAHWAGVADLAHHTLTGRLRTDHTLAGRTGAYRLPDAGAGLSRGFDPDLLAPAGLDADRLPPVGLPGDPPDTLTPAAAAATGLLTGTPVLVAGHDHQVAAWAGGVRRTGGVADSVGTAEAVLTFVGTSPDRAALGRAGYSLGRAVDGSTEVALGGSPAAGAFLQWLADRETGGDVEELLAVRQEKATRALAGPVFWLPYPRGRQCPAPDPDARPRLVGTGRAPGAAPPGVLALESVSYQAQWIADVAAHLTGTVPRELVTVGEPLRRSPLWPAVKATLAARPTRLVDVAEPVACGAALLALVRVGALDAGVTLPTVPVDPIPDRAAAYRVRLADFTAAATKENP